MGLAVVDCRHVPRIFARIAIAFVAFAGIGVLLYAQQPRPVSIDSIESALRNHDYEAALSLAKAAESMSPRDAASRARILTLEGIACADLGHNGEALTAFLTALKLEPNSLAALEGAAQAEFNTDDPRAETLLDRIVRLRPEDPTSHAMLAVIAYRKGDCAGAVRHFARGGPAVASQPTALTEYGACLLDEDRAPQAVAVLEQALTASPGDDHLRYNLAVAQQAAHQSAEAIATLRSLVEAEKPDPDALDLAAIAHDDVDPTPEAAVQLLRAAIMANPKALKYYLDFAALALKHSSWQVGIDIVNIGLKELPQAAPLYVARGILRVQQSGFSDAEADFETANRLDPAQTGAAVAAALARIEEHDPARAVATLDTELRTHPGNAFLLYMKSLALLKDGAVPGTAKFAQALEAARAAAAAAQPVEAARDLVAEMCLDSGRWPEAAQQSRLALAENPSDEKALFHLIQALRRSGSDPRHELPALSKRIDVLLRQQRDTETTEAKYGLYEPGTQPAAPPRQ